MEVSFFSHSFLSYAVFLGTQLGRKTRPRYKFCTWRGVGLDSIWKILSKELHIPMILRVNEWLFVNSTEERTKQVGTLRLNRPYSVTKKKWWNRIGKENKKYE